MALPNPEAASWSVLAAAGHSPALRTLTATIAASPASGKAGFGTTSAGVNTRFGSGPTTSMARDETLSSSRDSAT